MAKLGWDGKIFGQNLNVFYKAIDILRILATSPKNIYLIVTPFLLINLKLFHVPNVIKGVSVY